MRVKMRIWEGNSIFDIKLNWDLGDPANLGRMHCPWADYGKFDKRINGYQIVCWVSTDTKRI